MKVLYVNTSFQGGGAEKIARQLYFGMRKYGVDTYFAAGRDKTRSADMIIYDSKWSSGINEILHYSGSGICLANPYFKQKLLRYIRKEQIDIVHFHNIHGKYCGVKDIAEIAKQCKVVWTLHDCWPVTGHCAHMLGCDGWKENGCSGCERMTSYPGAKSQKRIQKAYDAKQEAYVGNKITFVTPSCWLKDIVKDSFLQKESIHVIHNGVSMPSYGQKSRRELCREEGIAPEKKILLFIAAAVDSEYKGYHYLKQALKTLKNKEKYTILVIGVTEGMSDLEEELDLRYLGYISDAQKMQRYYSLADVFVLSSVAENFPCVILEAMACGTPVIAFDVGGIREQIDETTGWLVLQRNTVELRDTIERALDEDAVLEWKSQNCKQAVMDRFTEEIMLKKYWELYQKL